VNVSRKDAKGFDMMF